MKLRKELKSQALGCLKSNWGKSLLFLAIVGFGGLVGSVLYGILTFPIEQEWAELLLAQENKVTPDQQVAYMNQLSLYQPLQWLGFLFSLLFGVPSATFFLGVIKEGRGELSAFRRIGRSLKVMGWMTIKIFLWTLLLIVPGIYKAFCYAMAPYVAAEHPDYTPQQCLDESTRMMTGYKLAFFVLILSFLGWVILASLVLLVTEFISGVAGVVVFILLDFAISLVLNSYIGATVAAFYLDLPAVAAPPAMPPIAVDIDPFSDGEV